MIDLKAPVGRPGNGSSFETHTKKKIWPIFLWSHHTLGFQSSIYGIIRCLIKSIWFNRRTFIWCSPPACAHAHKMRVAGVLKSVSKKNTKKTQVNTLHDKMITVWQFSSILLTAKTSIIANNEENKNVWNEYNTMDA